MLSSPEHVCCPLSLDYQQLLGGWDLLKCYMALSAKGDLKHWGWSSPSFSSLCHHHQYQGCGRQRFYNSIPRGARGPVQQSGGGKVNRFWLFWSSFIGYLFNVFVIFWYDSWWIKRAWNDFLNFSLDYRLFLDPHLCRPYTPTSPLPPQLLPFPSPPSLSFYG